MHFILALLLACALPNLAFAADDDGFDAHTIRSTDIPQHPPRFEQYPAQGSFTGHVATPDVRTQAMARLFRTRIRDGAKTGPNFAGHYTIVFWGCGTSCVALAIVDANTGQVFFPANLGTIDNLNVAYEELESPEGELINFRHDSRLIMVIGGINEAPNLRGISYFLWEGNKMRRILFVAKPYG